MTHLDPTVLAAIAAIMLLSGFIKGALGFGSNLIVIPLLALLIEPRAAVALVVIPSLVTLPLVLHRFQARWDDAARLLPFLLPLAAGTLGGAWLLVALSGGAISTLVGAIAVTFALLGAVRLQPHLPARHEPWITPLVGITCGLIGGASSAQGPAVAIYLQGRGFEKRDFLVAFSLVFLSSNLVQVASYSALGLYTPALLLTSALACLPMALGTHLGIHAQQRLHQVWFNRLVLAVIFVFGFTLIVRA